MPIVDLAAWRDELITTGKIPQDSETSVPEDEAVRRCKRYVELAEMADGTEGPAAVEALVSSMTADEDYGVYQTTHRVLACFPDTAWGAGVAAAAPALVTIPFDRSGEVLLGCATEKAAQVFNTACGGLSPALRGQLAALIDQHERPDGWLSAENTRGRLQPNGSNKEA